MFANYINRLPIFNVILFHWGHAITLDMILPSVACQSHLADFWGRFGVCSSILTEFSQSLCEGGWRWNSDHICEEEEWAQNFDNHECDLAQRRPRPRGISVLAGGLHQRRHEGPGPARRGHRPGHGKHAVPRVRCQHCRASHLWENMHSYQMKPFVCTVH